MALSVEIKITCPKCNTEEITLNYFPPTPDVFYLSNGDPGYPGDPAEVEVIATVCGCWDDDISEDTVLYGALLALAGHWVGIGDIFQERAFDADFETFMNG